MKRIIEHRSEVFNEIRQSVSRTLVAAESRCYEQRQPYNGNNTAGIQDKVLLGQLILPHGLPFVFPFLSGRR